MPATPRHDPPVCVHCDADLSCGACGVEQPYTDISVAKALLKRARQFVSDSGCDEDDTDVNAERDKLLAEIDAALQSERTP